ncbi:O-antigen ligase family protein [Roseofilum casamattae]|uniref:O-antigen ligase family protein n=1 Tax=Roseofilum casamattae BLCC-M143 TaxID=3022442 RepID=A0ABT7BY42_9CYAN|nr:O-antigen ligase family protein [Roseofilum casamattae]MDJ1184110.1 O-antigen ligase family protein [Roseofilum casamattae BLCC-M143]
MNRGLFLLLLYSSLLSRIKIPVLEVGVHFLLMGIAGIWAIIVNWNSFVARVRQFPLLWTLLSLFYSWVWIAALASDWRAIAIKYTIKYSIYGVAFCALFALLSSTINVKTADKIIFVLLTLIAMGGFLEEAFPHTWMIKLFSYPDNYPRIRSVIQGPNPFGVLMAIGSCLALMWNRDRPYLPKQYWAYPFLILTALSASRNGWLVWIVGLFLLLLSKKISIKLAVNLLCFWLVCLLLVPVSSQRIIPNFWAGTVDLSPLGIPAAVANSTLPEAPVPVRHALSKSSMQDRFILWKQGLKAARQYPISGVGLGVFQEVFAKQLYGHARFNTHNLFLGIAVELGLVGLSLFTIILAIVCRIAIGKVWVDFIPVILFLSSQVFDYFIYEYAMTTIFLYVLARSLILSGNGRSLWHREPC